MENTVSRNILIPVLSVLSEYVSERLRDKGYFTQGITVEVKYYNFISKSRGMRISPTNSSRRIFSVAKQLFIPLVSKPIRHLGIKCGVLIKTPPLFIARKENNLYKTVSSIRKKYGFNAVLSGLSIIGKKAKTI